MPGSMGPAPRFPWEPGLPHRAWYNEVYGQQLSSFRWPAVCGVWRPSLWILRQGHGGVLLPSVTLGDDLGLSWRTTQNAFVA